jgi:hypothetical protein
MDHSVWNDLFSEEFVLSGTKSKTVRYRLTLPTRGFDFYAPDFMLREAGVTENPECIMLGIAADAKRLDAAVLQKLWGKYAVSGLHPYTETSDAPVHSVRFNMDSDHSYSLYVPHEVFDGKASPGTVFLRLGIVGEEND